MDDFKNYIEERKKEEMERWKNRMENRGRRNDHIWTGLFILLIGVAALVNATVPELPDWVFSWQTLLIALGLFIGLRHRFKGGAWFILMLVGSVFLITEINPELTLRRYIWPMALIAVGIFFIFRPRSKSGRCFEKKNTGTEGSSSALSEGEYSEDNFVDSTSIFGGANKIILSKDFKGGDLVNIFGGTELNLAQADINQRAVLEMTTIFGGTKLIIPSNWSVKSEATIIFGGIEDKRSLPATTTGNPEKVLLLKGTVIFGGIEIKSF